MRTLVTNAEIEAVGEGLILKYTGTKIPPSRCVDIEGFIRDHLHLPIKYVNIQEDDLDKIGFISDGVYALSISVNGQKQQVVYPKGTVVLDRFLLHADRSGQRRFTLAHEAAHVIFERMSPTAAGPFFDRFYDKEREYSIKELREHFSLCEVQTDRLASVLLMPRPMVEQVLFEFRESRPIPLFGSCVIRGEDKLSIQKMADCMGVTFTALLNRLKTLGRIEYRDISEYIETEMQF